jgi:DNA-directed RNA polymerase specialized sigma24 family protein
MYRPRAVSIAPAGSAGACLKPAANLALSCAENLSYEEIGRALECSPTAVDALLVRAKRKLQERLRDIL